MTGHIYYNGYADSHAVYASSAAYTAAAKWNNAAKLGFSLNKVDSYSTHLVEVLCSDTSEFRKLYPEEYEKWECNNPNAIATTVIQESKSLDDTIKDHYAVCGSLPFTVTQMYKSVVIPFTTLSSQEEYDKVVTHEFGHALGWYGHNTNSACLMYACDNSSGNSTCDECFAQLSQVYRLTNALRED